MKSNSSKVNHSSIILIVVVCENQTMSRKSDEIATIKVSTFSLTHKECSVGEELRLMFKHASERRGVSSAVQALAWQV